MKRRVKICAAVALLVLSASAPGNTKSDAQAIDEPFNAITAKADRLELDQQSGVQTLSGNVIITQGNISIYGDHIQVHMRNGVISRIFAEGSPIRFKQQLDNGEIVQTESTQIDYITSSWTLVFKGDVILQRADWVLNSQMVEYNIRSKNFSARGSMGGNTQSATDGKDKRLSVTFKR